MLNSTDSALVSAALDILRDAALRISEEDAASSTDVALSKRSILTLTASLSRLHDAKE